MGICTKKHADADSDTSSYLSYLSEISYHSRIVDAIESNDLEFLVEQRNKLVCETVCKLGRLDIVKELVKSEAKSNGTLTDQGILKCIFQGNIVAEMCLKYAREYKQKELVDYLERIVNGSPIYGI